MSLVKSDWMWRSEDYTGNEWATIEYWRHDGLPAFIKKGIHDHEDAAEAVAKHLTNDDGDYYRRLESDGVEMEIRSPEGEVKKMRAGGYTDFVYTAEEVA